MAAIGGILNIATLVIAVTRSVQARCCKMAYASAPAGMFPVIALAENESSVITDRTGVDLFAGRY